MAVFVLVTGMIVAIPQVHAQDTNTTPKANFFQGLVEIIAQKFGLDKAKVQSVVTDYQTQQKAKRQQHMQERENARLDQLVKDGKISSAQKAAIVNELNLIRQKYNPSTIQNLTRDQRKTQIQNMQNELKTWAQSQGIDPSYLAIGGRGMKWGMQK